MSNKKKKKRLPEPEDGLSFIDAHCHVPYKLPANSPLPSYEEQYRNFIARGGLYMISCSLDHSTLLPVRSFMADRERFGYTCGWAPQNIVFMDAETYAYEWDPWFRFFITHQDEYLAIGELGLDFHHGSTLDHREQQVEVFNEFLGITRDWNKPYVLHVRNADPRSIDTEHLEHPYNEPDAATKLVIELLVKHDISPERVVWHCFSGPEEYGPTLAAKGFMLSVPSSAWSQNKWRRQTQDVPLENLLTETDAYFQHPYKFGPFNTPVNARYAVAAIAYSHNVSQKEVAEVTVENAIRFFGLEI